MHSAVPFLWGSVQCFFSSVWCCFVKFCAAFCISVQWCVVLCCAVQWCVEPHSTDCISICPTPQQYYVDIVPNHYYPDRSRKPDHTNLQNWKVEASSKTGRSGQETFRWIWSVDTGISAILGLIRATGTTERGTTTYCCASQTFWPIDLQRS